MENIEDSPTLLETERLILRFQKVTDIDPLVDLWTDPQVTRHLGGPRDRDQVRSSFAETAKNPTAEQYDLWPVIEKETGTLIGHCGLLEKDIEGRAEIELIYIFTSSAWGRGFATEIGAALKRYAFKQLGIDRLIALIEPGNQASEGVAQKLGMHLEKEVLRPGGSLRKVYAVECNNQLAAA
jgi:ribosomal-protein-alanine N-acetyltransferase